MTLDQDIGEKIVVRDKLKQEISELQIMKAQVVRDINIPLLEADKKAKAIIAEAKETAKSIIEEAGKLRSEALDFAEKTKQGAEDILRIVKSSKQETDIEKAQLEKDKATFKSDKLVQENKVKEENLVIEKLMAEATKLKEETDILQVNVIKKEDELNNKEISLRDIKEGLEVIQDTLNKDRTRILRLSALTKKEEEEVEKQRLDNKEEKVKIEAGANEVRDGIEINKKLSEELDSLQKNLNEKSETLTKQFVILEQTNKDIEEKKKSLEAQGQLIALRNKEVLDNIRVLQELRAKQ